MKYRFPLVKTMKLLAFVALIACSGCAYLTSNTVRYDNKTGDPTERTHVRVYTLFDAQSNLTKFRNTTGQVGNGSNVWSWPSGTTIGTYDQSVQSSNLVTIVGDAASIGKLFLMKP